jgi:amino acid adenylation domain-containing protein/non-ribosomal peptide synthase protein (TIGR01720 family)
VTQPGTSESGRLSDARLALLESRLRKAGVAIAERIPRRPGRGPAPLSHAQQRLWFLDQLEPGSTAYNIPAGLRLSGRLDLGVLERSLNEVVRRHEVLRTTFGTAAGQPVQVVCDGLRLPLPVVDLGGLSEAARGLEVRRQTAAEAARGFDLRRGPLLRVCVLGLADSEHVVLLTMHHIVSDGWSMGVLIREVSALYQAFASGAPPPLPELPLQYGDFAHWQREWLQGEVLDAQLSFWRQHLQGCPVLLSLATDRERPAVQTSRGAVEPFTVPGPVREGLLRLARSEDATLYMVLLAAFQALLGRYAGVDDVLVGTPTAGRNRRELESLIGFFVNTLVLRADLSGQPTVGELLRRVRAATLGAYAHPDVPFERLVDELQPQRSLSHHPLFQAWFVLQNETREEVRLPGLAVRPLEAEHSAAKFDLTLSLREEAAELPGELEYNTDLYLPGTIRRLAGHLGRLLAGMARTPEAPVLELPLLSDFERRELTVDWSGSPGLDERAHCVHELFAQQADRTPAAIAVVLADQQLSYGELDRRSSQLARHLMALGMNPEERVGLCVEPSLEMVVGVLGVLKAGAAYVPLDPQSPGERLRFVVEDAEVRVLLTQLRWRDASQWMAGRRVFLDRDWDAIARREPTRPEPRVDAANLAYVIYTSGSTGRPKGVGIEGGTLARHVLGMREVWELRADDRVLQIAPLVFDPSAEQIFTTLAVGARLILAGGDLWTAAELLEQVRSLEISTADLPTAYWGAVIDEWRRRGQSAPSLRLVTVGGEMLRTELARRWREAGLAWERLVNVYGPTETTVTATVCEVGKDLAEHGGRSIPIGRALAGRTTYVLDALGDLVPAGVAGELCLGGNGLARGYLARPDLTAEKFVPDPHGAPGSRLYRTGDLVRHLPDGNIEFLTRVDQQVKVRGFRIELGEIETVLAGHPDVGRSAALVREDRPGEKRLVAYVVGKHGHAPEVSRLRGFVASRLPEHMVPSAFVVLETLPLTATGKVDRRALPVPEIGVAAGRLHLAPRTAAEAELARIWSEVLGVARVGVEDNFFELGGDSILSIQVVARAREAGYQLTVKDLFQQQTVAGLAEVMRPAVDRREAGDPVAGPVPLSPIQQWFFEQEWSNPHHFNQSVLLEARGTVDVAALREAVRALARHHDALRLRFHREASAWRQWLAEDVGTGAFSQVDLAGVKAWRQTLADHASSVQGSLDLATGPLLRVVHYDVGEGGGRLLLAIHHLAVDGVSWRILLEDLQRAYEQLRAGRSLELPAKSTSFQEWVQRLQDHARSVALVAEAERWTSQAREQIARLPVDHEGGANTVGSARSVAVSLGAEETRRLLQELPGVYRTQIDEVLLAALLEALWRWTGESRVQVDLEGHGREELFVGVDLSRTVGWFTSLYPVLLDCRGFSDPGALLKAVKEQVRSAPHRGIGFGVLKYLGPEETRSRLVALPPSEISFNYLGQFDRLLPRTSPFAVAGEAHGRVEDPAAPRRYLLDVDALVGEGRLHLTWTYSASRHDERTIAVLADSFLDALKRLIAHCQSPAAGGCTPTDFPLAALTQDQLDRCVGNGRGVADVYPLSPTQQGMLFHAISAPHSGLYVEQVSCRIGGGVDIRAFKRAWQKVVDRHSILRSSFVWEGLPEPLQLVRRHVELSWEEADWVGLGGAEKEEKLAALLASDRTRGFVLDAAPLMRLALLQCEPEAYQLVWSHHHLLLDGWCTTLLFRELFTLYEGYRRGLEPQLPRPRPYRDYIGWLRGRDQEKAERFWRAALAGFNAPTPLPADGSQVSAAGGEDDSRSEQQGLSRETTAAVEALARRHHLTVNTVLQGAWGLLLCRYSGEEDVVFGATVAGRPPELPGVDSMLGLFINTLPVRVWVSPHRRAADYLSALQEQQVEARQYEYTALASVQRWSEVPPGTPLFESILVFENYPVDRTLREAAGEALGIGVVHNYERTNYPLTLVVAQGAELSLRLDFDGRRSSPALVRRLLGHLSQLLAGLAADPSVRLRDLPLVTDAEQRQLILEWNDTTAAYPDQACIHELFEEQAEWTPDATAIVFEHEWLSYRCLDEHANRLARHLRALGVGPEVRVGVCVERSLEMVVGLIAILKAGGAYVPLDPEYPRERLCYMLEDSGLEVLLAHQRAVAKVADELLGGLRIVWLERDAEAALNRSAERLGGRAAPEQLAYVMYTSGSTGRPKGVAVTHRGVVRLVRGADYATIGPEDVFLQLSPAGFDTATLEIWGPLLNGARLAVMPAAAPSLDDIGATLRSHCVSVLWLTAPLFHLMVDLRPDDLRRVTQVMAGADVLSPAHVESCRAARGDGAVLINGYGPTENTTFTCCHRLHRDGERQCRSIPIGRPIANTRGYVLDPGMSPCPIAAPGELYAGGAGLARGYWNAPDRTAERFVPNPFDEAGSRLYRTGDLVRYLPDGNLEFLGRMDHQVKLRGFRIELGEIEAVLSGSEEVGAAAVVVRRDRLSEQRLVAYVVGKRGSPPDAARLRQHSASKLPEYMVPAVFVAMETLPLTPSGKLDRNALPSPEAAASEARSHVAPQSWAELELASIWSAVLGVEGVGAEDNFFELGGDSILSIQVVSRAREAGYQLTLKQIFQHPTIAELARVAERAAEVAAGCEPVGGPVPLTPIQRWFFAQEPPNPHHFNQAVMLKLREPVELAALAGAVAELVRHHDALRLRFARQGEGWRQWQAANGAEGVFQRVELSGERDWRQALEADASQVQASLDLRSGPLLRVVHYRLGEAGERLLLAIHHLAVDGVSWRILLEDLQRAYDQLRAGRRVELPAKTTSFQEWSRRLSQHARTSALAAEEEHWASLAREVPARLPVDHAGGADTVESARGVSVTLSAEDTRGLLQEVPAAYRTQIDEVLLAALVEAVSGWTGESRVLVDLEGHGREELFAGVDLSRTVGWFTTLAPLVLDIAGCAGPGDLLKRVKEQVRGVPNRGIGYGVLRYLGEDEVRVRLAALPQAQISFNYLGQFDQVLPASSPFAAAAEPHGRAEAPETRRTHRLEVSGWISDGVLRMDWTFSEAVHRRQTIEGLAGSFHRALGRLIAHCRSPQAGGSTPADFPLAALDQDELDRCVGDGRGVEDVYPLSPMQEGLLFHSLFAPRSGVYVEQLSCRIERGLDVESFKRAWQAVVDRHPMLRSSFAWEELREPLQVVWRDVKLAWCEEDWRGLDPAEQRRRLDEVLQANREHGFDLRRAPLIRLALFQTGADAYRFVWCYHHVLLDGWCTDLLFKELFACYESCRSGVPLHLQRPRPYRDFVAWLRRQDRGRAEEFWRGALLGFRSPTPLGEERPPGSEPSADGEDLGEELLRLSRESTQAVEALARRLQVTLNTVLQGAWALLLSRYAGEDDVVFGATVSGRPAELAGATSMLGLFINTLPVRVRVNPDLRVREYLQALQRQQAEARAYDYSALVDIQSWSEVPRGKPLFASLLAFENYPVDASIRERAGETLGISGVRDVERTNYPLTLAALPGAELQVCFDYDGRRLGTALVRRMIADLAKLLAGMAGDAETRLGDLALVIEEVRGLRPAAAFGDGDPAGSAVPEERAGEERPRLAPRTATEAALARIWSEVLKVESVGVEDSFFDLGGDSLSAIRLLARVRTAMGVEVSLSTLFETPTVAELAELVGRTTPVEAGGAVTIRRLPRPSPANRAGEPPAPGRE